MYQCNRCGKVFESRAREVRCKCRSRKVLPVKYPEMESLYNKEKYGKDNENFFDLGDMKKSLKDMAEIMELITKIKSFNRGFDQLEVPIQIQSPATKEALGAIDPTMFYLILSQRKEKKDDFFENLIKYKEAMEKFSPPQPAVNDKQINDLKLEIVQSNAEREKASIEEKTKFQTWMNEFKHILEKSKMGREFNNKLEQLSRQLENVSKNRNLATEIKKYLEFKKTFMELAEVESFKKDDVRSGVAWEELIKNVLNIVNKHFEMQSNRADVPTAINEIPIIAPQIEEASRKAMDQGQQKEKFDYKNNFVGVNYNPNMLDRSHDYENDFVGVRFIPDVITTNKKKI